MTEQKPPEFFVRKATGLARLWTWWDGFWINFSGPNIPAMLMGSLVWCWLWPGGNPAIAILITGLMVMPMCGAYAILLATFPRAGGDYVIQSRIFGGGLSYVINLAHSFIIWLWVPVTAMLWIGISGQPMLSVLGYLTGNRAWLDVAIWWATPDGIFTISILVLAWVTFMIAVGAYWYRRVQRIGYYLGTVFIAIAFVLMLATSVESFASSYNSFMGWGFGVKDAYNLTIAKAAELGYAYVPFWDIDWNATFVGLVPIMMFMFTYVVWGNPMYGEITGAGELRQTWKSLWPANLFNVFLGIMIVLTTVKGVSWEFFQSGAYLWGIGQGLHPFYPYPQLYWSLASPQIGLLLAIGMNFWIWNWIMNFICTSRVALSMAFDRLLPEFVARVGTRFRAPYGALTMFAIFALILSYVYAYHGFGKYFLFASFGSLIAYGATCYAGMLFPFLRKEKFESSVARIHVGGVPLITILGAFGGVFITWTAYRWFVDANYGINSLTGTTFVIVIYAACIVSYLFFKYYRKRQGIDVTKTFRELPYE